MEQKVVRPRCGEEQSCLPGPPVTEDEDKTAFSAHSSTSGSPTLPFFFFGKHPTVHKFMATVEIHGATTFILVIFVF